LKKSPPPSVADSRGERNLSEKKKDNKEEKKSTGNHSIRVPIEDTKGEASSAKPEGKDSTPREKKEPTPLEKLQEQLDEKTREATERFDQWLRLRAEFENFKKRVQKEKADLMKFGNEHLLKALLPIVDNLERAIDHGRNIKDCAPLLEGVEITLKQFLSVLEKFGVKSIPALGGSFDPDQHEAVSRTESGQESNQVVQEIEKGYIFHDRLLRPAKVIVSQAKPES